MPFLLPNQQCQNTEGKDNYLDNTIFTNSILISLLLATAITSSCDKRLSPSASISPKKFDGRWPSCISSNSTSYISVACSGILSSVIINAQLQLIRTGVSHVIQNFGPMWAPGLTELTRSVSWPDVVQGDETCLSLDFSSVSVVLLTRATFCVVLFCVICVFYLLVVLVRLSVPV